MTIYGHEELKKKMVESANLAEFQDYFLSNFVEFSVHVIGEAYYKLSGATVIDFRHQ